MSLEIRKPEPGESIAKFWEDFDWDELNEAEQNCFGNVGWNKELWDSSGTVASDDKDWAELSETERSSLELLGFSESTWEE